MAAILASTEPCRKRSVQASLFQRHTHDIIPKLTQVSVCLSVCQRAIMVRMPAQTGYLRHILSKLLYADI